MPTEKQRFPPRSTFWSLNLYPDCEEHAKLVELLKSEFINDFLGILHDRDVTEEGELKKAHWHILFRTDSRCGVDKVSAITGVATHLIEPVHSVGTYKDYMLHRDIRSRLEGKKYVYDSIDFFGNLDYSSNKFDEAPLWESVNFMSSHGMSTKEIFKDLVSNGHYDFARKNLWLIKEITKNA